MKIKIVVDSAIPFINGVLEPYGEVIYADGSQIDSRMTRDADALIVRTRTKCNRSLLDGSDVKFIATATIGIDHIDTQWCQSRGITVVSAPGCNSSAVRQYFYTALYALASRKGFSLKRKTLGVIGTGNVGGKVADMASLLGFKVLRNDPPLASGGAFPEGYFTDLDTLLRGSDIVTLHVPLLATTRDMADESFFSKIKDGSIFVNCSRGEAVVDTALIKASSRLGGIVTDVWRGEPHINSEILDISDIATPHIAGYSKQGKINGTIAVVRAFAEHFDIEALKRFSLPAATSPIALDGTLSQDELCLRLIERYDIWKDDADLRRSPKDFERLRSEYDYRIEF